MMDWANERFIKVYTRDTADWMTLSFDAQALFLMILRKVDKSGKIDLGRHGTKAISVAIGHGSHWARLEPALKELIDDGCIQVTSDSKTLLVKNFEEAQESRKSNAQRQRDFKESKRSKAGNVALPKDNETSLGGNTEKHGVTSGNPSEQNRLEQNRLEQNRSDQSSSAPDDAKPSATAVQAPTSEAEESDDEPDPRSSQRADLLPPPQGTLAWKVFETLRSDTQWQPIVPRPSELAQRLADPDAYPAVDVLAEVKLAAAWLAANPKNRKKNGPRFLLGWLGRAQERAPRADQPALMRTAPPRGIAQPAPPSAYRDVPPEGRSWNPLRPKVAS